MTKELWRLPGLTDLHVHLRDPGQTNKEDFLTGTSAALAGGYTMVADMPNNAQPIVSEAALEAKLASARRQTVCDIGFHFGSLGENLGEFEKVRQRVRGLKLYLNKTTGNYLLDPGQLEKIFRAWDDDKPILLHAEADVIVGALKVAQDLEQPVHVCHVSSRAELEPIVAARRAGVRVTCGVTPHHLFLNEDDVPRLGAFGRMKPELKPQADVDYLWEHLDEIDVVESDHAPHTRTEKQAGAFGVPGLETTLPLLLAAEREGRLTRADIVAKCATGPRRILGLGDTDVETFVEVEPVEFEITNGGLQTKCGWTPFVGMTGFGRVAAVTIRGTRVFEDGRVLAAPGSGRII